jgi:hypothetical protein
VGCFAADQRAKEFLAWEADEQAKLRKNVSADAPKHDPLLKDYIPSPISKRLNTGHARHLVVATIQTSIAGEYRQRD